MSCFPMKWTCATPTDTRDTKKLVFINTVAEHNQYYSVSLDSPSRHNVGCYCIAGQLLCHRWLLCEYFEFIQRICSLCVKFCYQFLTDRERIICHPISFGLRKCCMLHAKKKRVRWKVNHEWADSLVNEWCVLVSYSDSIFADDIRNSHSAHIVDTPEVRCYIYCLFRSSSTVCVVPQAATHTISNPIMCVFSFHTNFFRWMKMVWFLLSCWTICSPMFCRQNGIILPRLVLKNVSIIDRD